MDYILEDVIAEKQVNLIGGASGSGKTRWIWQLKNAIYHQVPLLGYKTAHARWGYISGDRTGESIHETRARMGFKQPERIFSCIDHKVVGKSIQSIWNKVQDELQCEPTLLVVDGFTSFCPNGDINKYHVVAQWLAELQGFCQEQHCAILGACHTTKSREGEELTDPRQRIAGSVAWAAYTEGVVVIDQPHQTGDREPWRDIFMCGRNAGKRVIRATFNSQGWLEEREGEKEKIQAVDLILEGLLRPGTEHKNSELEKAAAAGGIGRNAFFRWLSEKKEKGLLLGGRGKVVVPAEEKEEEGMIQ